MSGGKAKNTAIREAKLLNQINTLKELQLPSRSSTVFLCGPKLESVCHAAKLRQRIHDILTQDNFVVFLGEHNDVEEVRKEYDANAQNNELLLIAKECDAVVIIPDSPGSFCELGLFSWHYTDKDGKMNKNIMEKNKHFAFIVLVDKQYEDEVNYINSGPIEALDGLGIVRYVNYESYDVNKIKKTLNNKLRGYSN